VPALDLVNDYLEDNPDDENEADWLFGMAEELGQVAQFDWVDEEQDTDRRGEDYSRITNQEPQ